MKIEQAWKGSVLRFLILLWLTILVFGCIQDSVQSTNLTTVDIPEEIDDRIHNYLPNHEIEIIYTTEAHGEIEPAEIEVCYEVLAGKNKLFGLASKVKGEWYVTRPNVLWLREKCSRDLSFY